MALRLTSSVLSAQRPETSASSKGPIYTTAGTVYNPKSALPLQPPARRGRSLKWTSGVFYNGLSLLPKTTLNTLAVGFHGGALGQLSQQYSPLQQNYDRAVSPVAETESKKLDSKTPRKLFTDMTMEEVNRYAVHSGDPEVEPLDEGSSDSEDDELCMKPLRNMTVKSLQNLASYPNPNQKMAQKALERSARSVKSSLAASAAVSNTNDNDAASVSASPSLDLHTANLMPAQASGFLGAESANKSEKASASYQSSADNANQTYKHRTSDGYSTLLNGPGAPRPLTAGPPGQRQYRPRTPEHPLRTQRGRHSGVHSDESDFSASLETDTLPSSLLAPAESTAEDESELKDLVRESTAFVSQLSNGQLLFDRPWELELEKPGRSSIPSHVSSVYPQLGAANMTEWAHNHLRMDIAPLYSVGRCDPFYNREQALERLWRSGDALVHGLSRSNEDKSPPYGAIGDGRPIGADAVREKLSVEEANSLPTSVHAKPLLELALATIETPGFRSQWVSPDTSLVDSSPEGNRSLWEAFGTANNPRAKEDTRET